MKYLVTVTKKNQIISKRIVTPEELPLYLKILSEEGIYSDDACILEVKSIKE